MNDVMGSRWLVLIGIFAMTWISPELDAEGRKQARSMVVSQRGIVATSQTLASQAGAQILARGGSATDAAIAANIGCGARTATRGSR